MPETDSKQSEYISQVAAGVTADTDLAEVYAALHAAKRQAMHAQHKAAQPDVGLGAKDAAGLFAALRAPLATEEGNQGNIDYLLQAVIDCATAGDVQDTVFALVRLHRCIWALNVAHLGPIEGGNV